MSKNSKTNPIGMRPYEELCVIVRSLGLKLPPEEKEHRPFPDWVETTIHSGRKAIARVVYYTSGSDVGSLLLHPVNPKSTQILAGEGRIDSEAKLDMALEDIEGLLRARLVLDGKLSYEQYPSDRALVRWSRSVLEQCGKDGGRFRARSAVAAPVFAEVVAIAAAFDRQRALTTQRRLAAQRGDHPNDDALRYMTSSAATMADVPFSRHQLAWETGSRDAYIAHQTGPVPTRKPL